MSHERSLPCLEFTPYRFSSIERRGPQASGRFRNFHSGPQMATPRQRLTVGVARTSPRQRGMRVPVSHEPTLGFSLKPPKWLKKDVKKVGTFVKKHETALLVGGAVLTAGLLAPGAVAAAGGALAHGAAAGAKFLGRGVAGIFSKPKRQPDVGPPVPSDGGYSLPPIGPPAPTSGPSAGSPFPNPSPDSSGGGSLPPYAGGGAGGGAPISSGDTPNTGAASPSATPTEAGFPILPLAIAAGAMWLMSRKAKQSSTARA